MQGRKPASLLSQQHLSQLLLPAPSDKRLLLLASAPACLSQLQLLLSRLLLQAARLPSWTQ